MIRLEIKVIDENSGNYEKIIITKECIEDSIIKDSAISKTIKKVEDSIVLGYNGMGKSGSSDTTTAIICGGIAGL